MLQYPETRQLRRAQFVVEVVAQLAGLDSRHTKLEATVAHKAQSCTKRFVTFALRVLQSLCAFVIQTSHLPPKRAGCWITKSRKLTKARSTKHEATVAHKVQSCTKRFVTFVLRVLRSLRAFVIQTSHLPPKRPIHQRLEQMLRLAQGFALLRSDALNTVCDFYELPLFVPWDKKNFCFLYLLHIQCWLRDCARLSCEVILYRGSCQKGCQKDPVYRITDRYWP